MAETERHAANTMGLISDNRMTLVCPKLNETREMPYLPHTIGVVSVWLVEAQTCPGFYDRMDLHSPSLSLLTKVMIWSVAREPIYRHSRFLFAKVFMRNKTVTHQARATAHLNCRPRPELPSADIIASTV